MSTRSFQREALSWGTIDRKTSMSPPVLSLELINIILKVINIRSRLAKYDLPDGPLSGIGKQKDFPVTLYGNSGAELLINGNIQN